MTREISKGCTPEAIAMRARSSYTRCDIVTDPETNRQRGYTTFFAVYTTPEGEVADRLYCFSDMLLADRRPPGYKSAREKIAEQQAARVQESLGRKLGDNR